MDKVCIGVPYFGRQEADWWAPLVRKVAVLPKQGVDFRGLIPSGTMNTDHNRNSIVKQFLEDYDAEWLMWIDADTVIPDGAIRRLVDTGKKLVSGIYYGKGKKGKMFPPIAYYKTPFGGHNSIDQKGGWERGEIIPVDSTGLGCLLSHRSVYEDIRKDYVLRQRKSTGGIVPIHKDKVSGKPNEKGRYDGHLIDGLYHERMVEPTISDFKFPYFALEYGKTEDLFFFDLAAESGHKVWLDTSVECGHLRSAMVTGEMFRKENNLIPK